MTNNPFFVAEKVVPNPGGEPITVRGLSVPDMAWLANSCGPALVEVFTRLQKGGLTLEADELAGMVTGQLLVEGPLLAASIIAAGCSAQDHVDSASRLPFPLQLELLTAIGELTFAQEGGAKKVFETVIRMATAVQDVTADLKA